MTTAVCETCHGSGIVNAQDRCHACTGTGNAEREVLPPGEVAGDEMDPDRMADVLSVMNLIGAMLRQPGLGCTDGFVDCPRCEGKIRWFLSRRATGTRRNSYAATCATPGCISFRGH